MDKSVVIKLPKDSFVFNINSFIYSLSLFSLTFSGVIKSIPIINKLGSFLNLFMVFVFFLCIFLRKGKKKKKHSTFFLFFVIIVLFYSFFYLPFLPKDIIGFASAFSEFLILSIVILLSINFSTEKDGVNFLTILVLMTLIILTFDLLNITSTAENINRLTRPHLYGGALIVIFLSFFEKQKSYFLKSIYFIIMVLIVWEMIISGSRGSLIFSLLIIIFISIYNLGIKNKIRIVISCLIIIFSIYFFIDDPLVNFYKSTPILFNRLERLVFNIEQEPRFPMYLKTLNEIIKNPLGYGFYSQRWLFNYPYVESMPLEVLLNFGIIGFLVFLANIYLCFKKFIGSNSTSVIMLFWIFVYLLLSFSKGWGFFDGMVIFIPYSIMININNTKEKFNG